MKTLTEIFSERLSQAVAENPDQSVSITSLFPWLCIDVQWNTRPGLLIDAHVFDSSTGRSFDTNVAVALGSSDNTDLLAADYYTGVYPSGEAVSLGESIARSLDTVINLYGLDRENLLESQGWSNPYELPGWLAQAFVRYDRTGSHGLTNPEEIQTFEMLADELDKNGLKSEVRFARGSAGAASDDWEVVFTPKVLKTEKRPELDLDGPLTDEQADVIEEFMQQAGWSGVRTPEEAAETIGEISKVPNNMRTTLSIALCSKTGIPLYELTDAICNLEVQQNECAHTKHNGRGR